MEKTVLHDDMLDAVSGGVFISYCAQTGDTLTSIAEHYKVSVEKLMKWNGIKDPNAPVTGKVQIKY